MSEDELLAIAAEARLHAYAPYSKFQVGAALAAADGQIFSAGNVENISFGLTMCAERGAVGAAGSQGVIRFDLLAIVSDSGQPVVPCGACRQVLAEFAPNLPIIVSTVSGQRRRFSLAELLPLPSQGILE